MEDLGCAREKCIKTLAELDSKKGVGLIERKRQGLGKLDIIYVKNVLGAAEPETPEPKQPEEQPEQKKIFLSLWLLPKKRRKKN